MKQSIYLTIFSLLIGFHAFAQDAIVTMTTANDSVNLYVEWIGAGSIFANGVELNNDYYKEVTISPSIDGLVVLTATGDAQLMHLNCSDNFLTALDVTKCSKLSRLICHKNHLSVLDVTKCSELLLLYCDNNSLSVLDITNCRKLEVLSCHMNSILVLDVINCPKLDLLWCDNNYLSALDVTKCPELLLLSCYNNLLSVLDVTNCPKLKALYAHNQTPVLPIVRVKRAQLRIKNPVTFTGAKVRIYNINHSGKFVGNTITWKIKDENGEATFNFIAESPDGVIGEPFSGIITQPWTKK